LRIKLKINQGYIMMQHGQPIIKLKNICLFYNS